MGQAIGASSTAGGRLNGNIGTAHTSSHVAIGAGWGGGTLEITSGSNDQRGEYVITAANTSPAQATATITITFADGAWPSAPFGVCTVTSTSSIDEGHVVVTTTTTGAVLTFSVLPVNTKVYTFRYMFCL